MEYIFKKNINGAMLKYIAVITMVIDHFAAIVVIKMFGIVNIENLHLYYTIMRRIGRIAFPIFCFLLIEGLLKTRNRLKYIFNLLIFAIISEIPFNLAFRGKWMDLTYQNVFFTLLISAIVVVGIMKIEGILMPKGYYVLVGIISLVLAVSGHYLALFMKTDYDSIGVIVVAIMYYFRKNRVLQGLLSSIALIFYNIVEWPVLLNTILFAKYNGERGKQNKYFFYIFYPVHILLFYFISCLVRP